LNLSFVQDAGHGLRTIQHEHQLAEHISSKQRVLQLWATGDPDTRKHQFATENIDKSKMRLAQDTALRWSRF
jgi:hypothetical protein